jgi:hypothetical protein
MCNIPLYRQEIDIFIDVSYMTIALVVEPKSALMTLLIDDPRKSHSLRTLHYYFNIRSF